MYNSKVKKLGFMKRILIIILLFMLSSPCFAQDVIIKVDGTELRAKVTKVGSDRIFYEVSDSLKNIDQQGTIAKIEVFMVLYRSGFREFFTVSKEFHSNLRIQALNSDSILLNKDLIDKINDTKALSRVGTVAIFSGASIFLLSTIVDIIARSLYQQQLQYLQTYDIQGNRWTMEGEYEAQDNIQSIHAYMNMVSISEPLMVIAGALLSTGITIKISCKNRLNKISDAYKVDVYPYR
jgi:hypothetical protein